MEYSAKKCAKDNLKVIAFAVLLFMVVLALVVILPQFTADEYFPDDTIWYCEELQLQLSFYNQYYSHIVIGGVTYRCVTEADRGSDRLYVALQEECPGYRLYATVFEGEYVSRNDAELVLLGGDGQKYTFIITDLSDAIVREDI